MKHKLISVALITILLCMFLGNSIACGPAAKHDLTISSTQGGDVTAPGEGKFTYDAGTVVNLEATPDDDCRFVNWTGNVGTIADVNDATTTITMNGDYTITANFALNMTFIDNVPDTSWPPTSNRNNYCAPLAMVNILGYWDEIERYSKAQNVTAFLQPPNLKTVADYLGYFMDTNNEGSKARVNDGQPGTREVDIGPGTEDFVRWDATHDFTTPPPDFPLPTGKLGYDWTVTSNYVTSDTYADAAYNESVAFYTEEIDNGRPLVVSFRYWNPVPTGISLYDPETEETIDVFAWGAEVPGSQGNMTNPEEYWSPDMGIGHAVTGVGYMFAWAPDGSGPYLVVIVHDNWPTPKNIAIPWNHWNSCHAVHPGS